MQNIFFGLILVLIVSSCGLNYVPTQTIENFAGKRKTSVENYIKDQYKDTVINYQTITFGETTVVKPVNYKLLDSLYTIKYNNEMRGAYDVKLEDQIGNQQQIVARDPEKVTYIEHIVYAINNVNNAEVNFSDVTLDGQANVTNFAITEQVNFPPKYLPNYKSYLLEESIAYPGYVPSNEDHRFYEKYKAHYQSLPFSEQPDFLVHTLKMMDYIKKIKSLETDKLIREICVNQLFARSYDSLQDNFKSMDGIFMDDQLTEYLTVFESNGKVYTFHLSPFLEIMSMQVD